MQSKSVIVTGGGSGIGRVSAQMLAQAGHRITIGDLNEDGCAQTVELIEQAGGTVQWIRTDVSVEDDVRAMVNSAVTSYDGLHGACNGAALVSASTPLVDLSLDTWNRQLSVNLTGQFLCVKHQVPAMLASGGGSIVIIGSTASLLGFPNSSDYCTAKAGLLGLVRSASCEYAAKGVRVNAVLPSATATPMLEKVIEDEEIKASLAGVHPIGRFGEPAEIGAAIRWLISDEASFVTGSAMTVDGGATSI